MEHALSRTELFRLLKRDPIPCFVKPNLMTKLAGPIQAPEVASLTSVRRAAQTLFNILRDPGFVLGAFAMGKVYDWGLAFWTNAIQAILDTLTNPGGVVKCESAPTQAKPAPSPTMTPSPRYQSSENSDISVESPKRMSMERPPRVMQLTSAPTRVETPAAPMGAIPRALEDAIVLLMQSTLMKSTAAQPSATCHESAQVAALAPTPPEYPAPVTGSQPEPVDDVDMKSVSSQSTTRSKHHRDEEDPGDLFALEDGAPGTVTAISTATAGTGQARVRLSASSELNEFHGGDLSDEKARAWLTA
ncbi:Eukaryotic/viral aspartic protease [Phytophthora cinnamomi]|uniref:Eukaryotic/viral aspartic protease n=1 Tax=Phytophthora cinnamomi TaxID=4785 RepID=UPI00355AAB01|nr:Eukaryotic/viral aspartic protease [Phytophthora cinnamomi]